MSISNDLVVDAQRDLSDCGCKELRVVPLHKQSYGDLGKALGDQNTVLFTTYSSLVAKQQGKGGQPGRSRVGQIMKWLGPDFEGCIVFDESHKCKNLFPQAGGQQSRTGRAVVELQRAAPQARVLYCSATGASEPRNLGARTRTPFWEFSLLCLPSEKVPVSRLGPDRVHGPARAVGPGHSLPRRL